MIETAQRPDTTPPPGGSSPLEVEVAIVGSGFSGLGVAIALKKAGTQSFVVLEKASDVGGTWRDNQYPGCACDIPARLYSYSFDRDASWSRLYPQQPEIWAYLRRMTEKYSLRSQIRFDAEVVEARFDEAASKWHVLTKSGLHVVARFLAIGTGPLSKPAIPHLPGLERFAGPAFHSSQWRHDVDLSGKDVAVVGTGASAIQFIPKLQPIVKSLTVYQRTAPWVIPKPDRPVGPLLRALLRLPGYDRLSRFLVYWTHEVRAIGFFGPRAILESFEASGLKMLEEQVADPALREKLVPTFLMGCKRVLIANDYYSALAQPNVDVVTHGIADIVPDAIVATDGVVRRADAIVLGTGFVATEWIAPMRVYGRGGAELSHEWKAGVATFLGINVAGFPNLFMFLGPNTSLGHNSVVLMIEAQIRYFMRARRAMKRAGVAAADVRPDVQDAFERKLKESLKKSVWQSGCKSWYLDEFGRNTTLWPGFTFDYFRRTARFEGSRYDLTPETAKRN